MNITSMDMNTLFHTLTGKAPAKPIMDVIKDANAKQEFVPLKEGLENAGRDTFIKAPAGEIMPQADSVNRLMDYDTELDMKVRAGMTKAQLATHFGNMAKRLDEAYSRGEFKKEEYDELNAGLMESYDKYISRCEHAAAGSQVLIIRAIERNKALRTGNIDQSGISRKKRNIENILEGMKEHRESLRAGNRSSDAVTVLKMLEQLEKNSGGDGSRWKKLADELRQSIRDTAADAAKAVTEKTDTSDIPDIADIVSDPKTKSSEDSSESGGAKKPYTADPEKIRQIAEEISEQTDAFAAKYCVTDREQMRAMLETVRRGGSVAGGNDNTFGGKRDEDWYIEGYVPVVYM